ncbi:ADP-dependent glucokinase-like isoform X1 [Biomphalaria glabrata]|uniref:ADP-dependent glucokinase-like isoform X1 n=1 Tax=Biomphalaria glabrata TaxID=6526 RepID=A0A9U8EJJ2_BIOGL|nr:ADP-dependent glucokinase-like isoform X1 [Biomphalaria glabrata]
MSASYTIFFALCFALVSYLFFKYSDNNVNRERVIIDSWTDFIKPPTKQFQKLSVGVNSNIDIIVSGVSLLKALNISPGNKKNNNVLSSFSELQETFSYYFARGSAAERTFADQVVYQKIIQAAETLRDVEHFIGGNAALMAKKASSLFPKLIIHFVGPVGPLLESLMPKSIKIPESCHIPKDEIHLIMEYKIGEKWGNLSAPVANRFITSHDESNSKVVMLEPFFESIKVFQPDLMLLSGLNIMDGQSQEFFNERFTKLVTLLKDVPSSIPVHLELASMATKDYVKLIIEQAVPNVDSLGLNEQEIVFASKALDGPHHDHFDDDHTGQPEIYKISDIMLWTLKTYGKSTQHPLSRLTRIHFHSLTFHIIAVEESAWSNVDKATAAGAQVAGLQACNIAKMDENLVMLKIPLKFKLFTGDVEKEFDPHNPVITWKKDNYYFVFSPVLVCKHPVKTVGLGDAISATGLMFSEFHS